MWIVKEIVTCWEAYVVIGLGIVLQWLINTLSI